MKKVMFSLKQEEIDMIKDVSDKDRRTQSGLIAKSVEEYAQKRGYVQNG